MEQHKTNDSQPEADTGNTDTLNIVLQALGYRETPPSESDHPMGGLVFDEDGYAESVNFDHPGTFALVVELLRESLGEDAGFLDAILQYQADLLSEAERRVKSVQCSKAAHIGWERRRALARTLPVLERAKPKPPTMTDIMTGLRQRARPQVFAN